MAGHGIVIKNLLKFMIFKKKGIGKLSPISFCVENKKKREIRVSMNLYGETLIKIELISLYI